MYKSENKHKMQLQLSSEVATDIPIIKYKLSVVKKK